MMLQLARDVYMFDLDYGLYVYMRVNCWDRVRSG